MKTGDDIESFLTEMEANYELVGDQIWVVQHGGPEVVLSIAGPLLVFRVKVIDEKQVAADKLQAMYRQLLLLNASEMVHGAYGLEEDAVVITAALQLENLDFNEFQASMEDMSLAVSRHYPLLSRFAA